jgi:ribose transport system substrate-binding protein
MQGKTQWFWAAALALGAALASGGCSAGGPAGAEPAAKTITVIPKGTTHIFWQSVHLGAEKAGKDAGVKVAWVGPEKEDDRQQQIALVDNQALKGVDGIVLAPLDAKALRRPVQAAANRKIPVVIMDSNLDDGEAITVSFVATDNRAGGRMAALALAEAMQNRGKVIMLRYLEGSASTANREEGFLEEIAKLPGIEVASSEQYGGPTTAQNQQAAENLLLRFKQPDGGLAVQGIFAPNESTTFGMLQALRRNQLAGKAKFVGFDASPPLIEGLKAGDIDALVAQNPFKMGYLAVKTLVDRLNGMDVPRVVDTGATLLTPQNPNPPEGL